MPSAEPEVDERVRQRVAATRLYEVLGISVARARPGTVEVTLLADDRHVNVDGAVHGGIYVLLADTAMGFAARLAKPPDSQNKTLELSTDFFGAAAAGDLLAARAEVVRSTGRLTWTAASVVATTPAGEVREVGRARSLNYEVRA